MITVEYRTTISSPIEPRVLLFKESVSPYNHQNVKESVASVTPEDAFDMMQALKEFFIANEFARLEQIIIDKHFNRTTRRSILA